MIMIKFFRVSQETPQKSQSINSGAKNIMTALKNPIESFNSSLNNFISQKKESVNLKSGH